MNQAMKVEFIPECHGDTELIRCLGISRKMINHQKGNGNLANAMRKNKADKVIGITDEDKFKTLPKYFDDFIEEKQEQYLILKKHKNIDNQYLIIISKDLEDWLLYSAKLVKISPKQFHLPEDIRGFKEVVKDKIVSHNRHFIQFINALKKAEAKPFITLENWLKEFLENT
jgi:hypothetical protein